MASFAYLFERFPSLTQTFCYREVGEMFAQGATPPIFSIRQPADPPRECLAQITEAVTYLPDADTLAAEMKTIRMVGRYPWKVLQTIHRWGKRPGKGRLTAAAWLGPKLKAQGVTHVHTHFAGIGARTAYWLKQFYGITYSFTGHANDLFCETDQPVSLADLVREASAVVTVADYSLAWLRRNFPAQAAKMHRVYNGIETAGFPLAQPDPAAVPLIVSVGRCIEKKGYADLIDACALLRESGARFECVIIGGGPLEEALRARIGERGLEGIVRLTGLQPQTEVRRWLSQASLFALACATEADGGMDNLPTVIAEAMACALPVVSTRLAGVPEMVAEGETGLLVEEKQPQQLAGAIRTLLDDPELRRRFGQRGKAVADERFAVGVTARQLRELLESL
jgi:colanic acid/amylovoran biosynthesis glycosyltransferase